MTLVSSVVDYQEGTSGTVAPAGAWTTSIPSVAPGNYLWTRTTLTFSSGAPVVSYSVSRNGIDNSRISVVDVELLVSDWSENTCTKQVIGVTATNNIIIAPGANSFLDYNNSQIRAVEQGLNTVTFACETVPEATITVVILIIG